MSRALDPRRVAVFAAVANAGSLAGAARICGWTQPAVSQHIQQLERDVGQPLLVRGRRGVDLTAAGRVLAHHAERMIGTLDTARKELDSLLNLEVGQVRIAAFYSACAGLLPSAITLLSSRYPQLEIQLFEAVPSQAHQLLSQGEVDVAVAFRYDSCTTDEPLRASLTLPPDPMRVVVHSSHPLSGQVGGIDLHELSAERWISGCPQCRNNLVATTRAAGFMPDIRYQTDDYVTTQCLVGAGLGVALLPDMALRVHLEASITALDAIACPPRLPYVVCREGASNIPVVSAAMEAISQVAYDGVRSPVTA